MARLRDLTEHPFSGEEKEILCEKISRRTLTGGFAGLLGLAATLRVGQGVSAKEAISSLGLIPSDLPKKTMKAAFSEVGFASTWVAHGVDTSHFFGDLLGVEITSSDGQLSVDTQLNQLQEISTQQWDFVAVHPSASDALVDAANAIIAKKIPLIDMDTRFVQDPAAFAKYGHLTFIEPNNIYMGETSSKELFQAIGGEGEVIHTQGLLSHTGAQGRAKGFHNMLAQFPKIKVVDETPGDWKADKVASLWQDLLQRFPNVKGGFFHSDDMALAARSVIEAAGKQNQVKISGVDGLRNACEAILADKMTATVINPSGRIHGGAVWAGYLQVSKTDKYKKDYGDFPKFVRADGGPITKDNAPGYIWLGDNLLY